MATVISELLVKIGVKVDDAAKAERQIDKVEKKTKKLGKTAGKSTRGLASMAKAVGKTLAKAAAAGALAIAGVTVALFALVKRQTAAIDKTNKLSKSLGLGVEELQRLEFAAERSGASSGSLQKGILKLNEALFDMQAGDGGKGPGVEALRLLGLEVSDLDQLSKTQQIGLIGEALQGVEDEGERGVIAMDLFGKRAGPELATLLAEGQAGLEALGEQAANVVSQEDADRASAFQDTLTNFNAVVQGLVNSLAVDLIPLFEEIVLRIQAWLVENDEVIKQNMASVVSALATLIGALVEEISFLVSVATALANAFETGASKGGILGGVLDVLITVVKGAITPFTTLRTLIGEIANLMAELGVITVKTADDFNASIGNMETSSSGLNTVAGRFDGLTGSINRTQDAVFDLNAEIEQSNLPFFQQPGARKAAQDTEAKRQRKLRRAPVRTGGAGGGKPKTTKPKTAEDKPKPPGVTGQDLVDRILRGQTEELAKQIEGLKLSTPSTADVQPTVAIDFFQFNFEKDAFNITSTDPVGAGTETANAIEAKFRRKLADVAQGMGGNTKR